MRLDHVSYATTPQELSAVVERLGASAGGAFVDGGRHPRFGTRAFVLPLAGGSYLEVVTVLDHPSADSAPFGQAVRRRADGGGGWLAWVIAVDDMSVIEDRVGRPAVAGHRVRPDGVDLAWRQLGVYELLADPQLPFFVQWLVDPAEHPSAGAAHGVRIQALEVCGSPERLAEWIGAPPEHLLDDVEVRWVESSGHGLHAVHLDTPHGVVRLD